MSKNKNVSKLIPLGTTFQTRDEFLSKDKYTKPGYERKGYYRKVVAVATNRKNEFAIVKLLGHSGLSLPNYKDGKSKYKPYVEISDNEDKPIKHNNKFKKNSSSNNLSKQDVNSILINARKFKINKIKLKNFKGR